MGKARGWPKWPGPHLIDFILDSWKSFRSNHNYNKPKKCPNPSGKRGVASSPVSGFSGPSEKQKLAGDKIRGVNLGGWLVLEPWITPSLFEIDNTDRKIIDEYTFCQYLEPEKAKTTLKSHWDKFVTLKDFQELQEAGITHVRLPIGYWAFEKQQGEPWIDGQIPYMEKAMEWANMTSMKLLIDIHGAPGSQNGFDNSGRFGNATFLEKENFKPHSEIMKRVYQKIGNIVTKNRFGSAVDSLELVNEPQGWLLDVNNIRKFYTENMNTIPSMFPKQPVKSVIHDAFRPNHEWNNLTIPNKASNLFDMHIYQVFDPNFMTWNASTHLKQSCHQWNNIKNVTDKGVKTFVGEWSLATKECTKHLNGLDSGSRHLKTLEGKEEELANYKVPSDAKPCEWYDDMSKWDAQHQQLVKEYFLMQAFTYENAGNGWYFWNFKAENSPEWNFLKLVKNGYIDLSKIPQLKDSDKLFYDCPRISPNKDELEKAYRDLKVRQI